MKVNQQRRLAGGGRMIDRMTAGAFLFTTGLAFLVASLTQYYAFALGVFLGGLVMTWVPALIRTARSKKESGLE